MGGVVGLPAHRQGWCRLMPRSLGLNSNLMRGALCAGRLPDIAPAFLAQVGTDVAIR